MAMTEQQLEPVVMQRPDSFGRLGKFGGKYVPETLMYALTELETAFKSLASDQEFQYIIEGLSSGFMFVLGGVGIVLLDLALDKNRAKSVKVSYASAGVASVVISYVMSMLFVRIKIPGFGQKKMVWVRWGTICLPKYHGGSYKEHYVRTWGRLLCRSSSKLENLLSKVR